MKFKKKIKSVIECIAYFCIFVGYSVLINVLLLFLLKKIPNYENSGIVIYSLNIDGNKVLTILSFLISYASLYFWTFIGGKVFAVTERKEQKEKIKKE